MDAVIDAAFGAIESVHRLMSFHEPASDVGRLNREACLRPTGVHAWTFEVLEAAVELHRQSRGIFDIAIAPALQSMGLLPGLNRDSAIATPTRSFDAIELIEGGAVRFRDADVRIDLGGIAKGFAVDRALEVLRRFGMPSGMVNAGGDLATFGQQRQTIHIRNRVELDNEAVASSARRFDPFQSADTTASAIIDPGTSKPAQAVDGATVRASSCMIADALTKIAMISGTDAIELLEHYQASALLVSAEGDVCITPDWHHAVYLAA